MAGFFPFFFLLLLLLIRAQRNKHKRLIFHGILMFFFETKWIWTAKKIEETRKTKTEKFTDDDDDVEKNSNQFGSNKNQKQKKTFDLLLLLFVDLSKFSFLADNQQKKERWCAFFPIHSFIHSKKANIQCLQFNAVWIFVCC